MVVFITTHQPYSYVIAEFNLNSSILIAVVFGPTGRERPAGTRAFELVSRCGYIISGVSVKRSTGNTRTRTRQQNTRQQHKPLTRTQSEQRRNDA